jgi:hypothetical protein
MTAEVAILNKLAVALAADSAVTVQTISGQAKVYNSANKLFSLSSKNPVGIMVYGNAEFMGVPWETIIKECRKALADTTFLKISEYAEYFFEFLKNATFFSSEFENLFIERRIADYFMSIKLNLEEKVKQHLKDHGEISESVSKKMFHDIVNHHNEYWKKLKILENFPESYPENFINKRRELVSSIVKSVFEGLPRTRQTNTKLNLIASRLFCFDAFPDSTSGIVIAGFGEADVFPALLEFACDCRIDGSIKYLKKNTVAISEGNTSAVVPYAQREMVSTFMEGIDPMLKSAMEDGLRGIFKSYCDLVRSIAKEPVGVCKQLDEHAQILFENFNDYLKSYRREMHIQPVVDMVAVLPKDELAVMAEALVNLTSLKRRVTADTETVGGPIDVAIITKGDGLVWIKRKHYFNPEFNHQYFQQH